MGKKIKIKPWVKWGLDAEKAKKKVMGKLCNHCQGNFEENGVSAYPGICRKCANVNEN